MTVSVQRNIVLWAIISINEIFVFGKFPFTSGNGKKTIPHSKLMFSSGNDIIVMDFIDREFF